MVVKRGKASKGSEEIVTASSRISRKGIRTGEDFANLMSAIMTDVIDEKMTPAVAKAVCNAGGKLLEVVKMQYKYTGPGAKKRSDNEFVLSPGGKPVSD